MISISFKDVLALSPLDSLGAHFVFSPIGIPQRSTLLHSPMRALVTYTNYSEAWEVIMWIREAEKRLIECKETEQQRREIIH